MTAKGAGKTKLVAATRTATIIGMLYLKVTYKVKPDQLETVRQIIDEFVAGIRANEPTTYYEAFSHPEEPLKFTHFMAFVDEAAQKYHQTAPHTENFVSVLYPNCDEQPVFTKLNLVATTK
jgi:quinol monooxygenase YgiN